MPDPLPRLRQPRLAIQTTKERHHYRTAEWHRIREAVLVRDAYRCAVCRRVVYGRKAHVDHVVPLEDGGTDSLLNLQVLCDEDHGRKTRAEQARRGYL